MMGTKKKKNYGKAIVTLLAVAALAVSILPNIETASASELCIAVFRLYNPNSGDHHYTTNKSEKDTLVSYGWNYEGIGWGSATENGKPVYRLYNPNEVRFNHHYTMNEGEKNTLVSLGWKYEGIGWYSWADTGLAVQRVYNPNSGEHFYTMDLNEKGNLVSLGWNYEGIAWYASPETPTEPKDPTPVTPVTPTEPEDPTPVTPVAQRERNLYLKANSDYYDFYYSGDKVDWANAPTAEDYNTGKAQIPQAVVNYYEQIRTKYPNANLPELEITSVYYGVYKKEPFRIFETSGLGITHSITEYGEQWDPNEAMHELLGDMVFNGEAYNGTKLSRYTGETAGINKLAGDSTEAYAQTAIKQQTRNGLSYAEAAYRLWARQDDPIWGNGIARQAKYSGTTSQHGGINLGCAAYAMSMQEFAMDYGYDTTVIDIRDVVENYNNTGKVYRNDFHILPGDMLRYDGHWSIVLQVLAEGEKTIYLSGDGGGPGGVQGIGNVTRNNIPNYIYSFWPDVEAHGDLLPDPTIN